MVRNTPIFRREIHAKALLALHGLGFRGAARVAPSGGLAKVNSVHIRGGPTTWSGVMRTRRATLRYDARAATPVSPEVEGGGFVGFTWKGDLDGASVSGAGFSEFVLNQRSHA